MALNLDTQERDMMGRIWVPKKELMTYSLETLSKLQFVLAQMTVQVANVSSIWQVAGMSLCFKYSWLTFATRRADLLYIRSQVSKAKALMVQQEQQRLRSTGRMSMTAPGGFDDDF